MGATGQPAKNTERREGSRPWWGDHRTTVFAVFGTVAGICTAAMGVVDRGTQIVLLVVSVGLFLAGLAGLVRVRTYARWFAAAWTWAKGHRIVVAVVTVVVLAGSTGAAVALQSARSCEDPTEVAVMVPEDGAAGFAAVADAFERDSVTPFSCPRYHVTTFGMGWPALRAAFESGWGAAAGQDGAASLDLGPRPDAWLAESMAQVDIVAPPRGAGTGFTVSGRTLVAGSPLVLAVPEPHAQALRATTGTGDTVQELMAAAGAAGLDVVRGNPDASFAAALHTERLYAGSRSAGTEPAAREALELDLGHALERAGLPLGTDGALLCRLDELSEEEPPRVAVLTSERAMVDRGAACPARAAGAGDGTLVPFYPEAAVGLDYQAVELTWADAEPSGRRAAAAAAFVEWLGTSDGQEALDRRVRVRGVDGRPPSGDDGPLPGLPDTVVETGAGIVADTRVLAMEEQYRAARRPARVLVLVDSSASMGRPADGDRLRIDVAERGVLGALDHLSGSDEVGIWSFSGNAGSSPRPVLDVTGSEEARREAPKLLRDELRPEGHTPLYDAIDATTSELVRLDPDGASRRHLTALVVLTDGENHPGDGPGAELTASDLMRSARTEAAAGVRVYVVAVGEASCQVSDLRRIAAEWDGECWDTSFGELEGTLAGLFGQLGGR
ncbi:VWA domain-containing protein [Promicromonospora sp. NPDC060271]|uniref:vWA domain-containing protein n=1 Tax=Promicromonospora sp. NPDC060271 TaxID=3347089 RepID=UPI003666DA29